MRTLEKFSQATWTDLGETFRGASFIRNACAWYKLILLKHVALNAKNFINSFPNTTKVKLSLKG